MPVVEIIAATAPREGQYGQYQRVFVDDGHGLCSIFVGDNYGKFPVEAGDEVTVSLAKYEKRRLEFVGPFDALDCGRVIEKDYGPFQFVKVNTKRGVLEVLRSEKHALTLGEPFPAEVGQRVYLSLYQVKKASKKLGKTSVQMKFSVHAGKVVVK